MRYIILVVSLSALLLFLVLSFIVNFETLKPDEVLIETFNDCRNGSYIAPKSFYIKTSGYVNFYLYDNNNKIIYSKRLRPRFNIINLHSKYKNGPCSIMLFNNNNFSILIKRKYLFL